MLGELANTAKTFQGNLFWFVGRSKVSVKLVEIVGRGKVGVKLVENYWTR